MGLASAPYNPGGNMGFGCIIIQEDEILWEWSGFQEEHIRNSNNVAEYVALENCLDYLIHNGYTHDPIRVYGDSKLVIKQMNKSWRIKEGRYVKYALACLEKRGLFKKIIFSWIPRAENFLADELSKKEFTKRGIKDISDMTEIERKYARYKGWVQKGNLIEE